MITDSVSETSKAKLKPPLLYQVVILDDDISTIQCVMDLLVNYFNKTEDEAFELSFEVDLTGIAVAGIYPRDIAETKLSLAQSDLKSSGYPLQIKLIESSE